MQNTSEVLFRLCANTDPASLRYGAASPQRACRAEAWRRRDGIFTKGPSDVLDHATIDAKKLPGEGFKRPWPPLIRMGETVRTKMVALFGGKL